MKTEHGDQPEVGISNNHQAYASKRQQDERAKKASELLQVVSAEVEAMAMASTAAQRAAAEARHRQALDAFNAFVLGKDGVQ